MMKKIFSLLLGFLMINTSIFSNSIQFIPCDDPRLNQKAAEVSLNELSSPQIQELIKAMLKLSGHEADPSLSHKNARLVGLAAPQIGVLKQIIIIDSSNETRALPQFEVLINPKITWASEKKEALVQGCYSVPDVYKGVVTRPGAVEVEGYRPDGTFFKKKYEGYPAHVVQHEIDHLEGIRFPERLKSEIDLHYLPHGDSDLPNYRKRWKSWKLHPSIEVFSHLKNKRYDELNTESKTSKSK